ncbi:biotin--[acetyl-CoA-carboxylase] ligase [Candidatus Chlamydia sanziniae]|uniref:Biotin-protein ligase n=1 Tax=Candidatus Chlamydia sanziniae TaxID=1806891 RepID=A0A1A9HX45_9CHLA|nr:biotin--[acetyl-CoA-carboxylase] ligase [Candidatus Chlamydia sanziniae]ANH78662.1 Biotin-protein ligase [Candidatus Chlamydia sanziniae]
MKVIHYEIEKTPSTNDIAKEYMHLWNPYALTVISTHYQTHGRGTFGKTWSSSRGDILNTLCFFITDPDIDAVRLFRLGTKAVIALTQDLGISGATIKWPNDVVVQGKKLSGILSETIPAQGFLGIALGIAINGNTSAETLANVGQPATSLQELLGHSIDVEASQKRLIHHMLCILKKNLATILPIKFNHGEI